ncbi:MAG: YlxR family protein [Acidimicrobiales bacterium]
MGCRSVRGVEALRRVVAGPDGDLTFSLRLPGRGAWLCAATALECASAASRHNRWSVALRRTVSPEQAERLLDAVRSAEQEPLSR